MTGADPRLPAVSDALHARRPIDDRERRSIARVELELARLPRPFDEPAGPVHVTGSAFVVGPRGVVLLLHRRLGVWVQPGGHLDPDETPWDAARREAHEETGLDVAFLGGRPELGHVDVHAGGRGHTHLDLRYLLDGGEADPAPPAGESQDVHWFAFADAPARAEPTMTPILHALHARFG
ncbi:MAG: NUDIX domain-containing protein [Actinomycetota bacterium]|nr:NUDIX domain-containing protein [Actinomycetota bacterium]